MGMEVRDKISAADIEKYGYCPLSWILSWNQEKRGNSSLRNGQRRHEEIAQSVYHARKLELKAVTMERVVLWCAVIATLIAVFGIELLPSDNKPELSGILLVVSLIWILASLIFLQAAFRTPVKDKSLGYERIILIFAIAAVILAINAVVLLEEIDETIALWLEAISLTWLILASFFLQRSITFSHAARNLKRELNIDGVIEYIDLNGSRLLTSEKFGITGRPDYVLMVNDLPIPVEEKTGRTPKGPLFSHILQVAAYCLLLEETMDKSVPYGVLKYGTDQHVIEFDASLKKTLLEKIDEMRRIADGAPAHRNHNRPNKCMNCSRRNVCPEKLV